jgi:titin
MSAKGLNGQRILEDTVMRTLFGRRALMALVAVMTVGVALLSADSLAGTTLDATPSTKTVEAVSGAATVEIDVVVNSVTNMTSWQFHVHNPSAADGSLPRVTSVTAGADWNGAVQFWSTSHPWGYVVAGMEDANIGRTGNIAIAHLVISYGTAPAGSYTFTIDTTELVNTDMGTIAHTITNFTLVVEAAQPPQPDPPTLSVTGKTTQSIDLQAGACTDRTTPVLYQFNKGPGSPGTTFRDWAESRLASDTSLAPNTQYTYRVRAKDSTVDQNTTGWSVDLLSYTFPVAPNVTCNRTAGSSFPTGTTFTFTNAAGWGAGSLDHYRYVWGKSATHTFNGTEPDTWDIGTLPLVADTTGVWYLHVSSENPADEPGGAAAYGPFDVAPVPNAPTDFAHTGISTDSITWAWTDASNDETGFRGYDGGSQKWNVGAGTTSHTESGLATNTLYTRTVRAFNAYGESAASDPDSAYTAIEAPTGIVFGTVATTSIQARSTNTPSNLTSGTSGLMIHNSTVPADSGWKQNNDFWTNSGLVANKAYTYYAEARNGDAVVTTPSPNAAKWTLPVAPNVTCDRSTSGFYPSGTTFTFTNAAGWGAGALDNYLYVWNKSATYTFTGGESSWSQAAGNTKALVADTVGLWHLHVMSRNGENASGVTATYGPFDVGSLPAGPTGLTHTAIATDGITWSWTDNATDEEGYRGYEGGTQKWSVAAGVTSRLESGLNANTSYTRTVKAYNKYGESAASSPHVAYTAVEAPTGIVFGTVATTSIQARSTNTPSNLTSGASGLRIQNSTVPADSGWKQNNDFWTSSGLVANKAYTFYAEAQNGDAVVTDPSPNATKWTLPVAPNVTCDRLLTGAYPTGTTFTFTNAASWGPGALDHYLYAWNKSATYTFPGGESTWSQPSGDTKALVANSAGMWYLHVKSRNGENASGGIADYGPFDVGDLPGDPTGFGHTAITTTSITWSWADNSTDEEGFHGYDLASALKWSVGLSVTSRVEGSLSANAKYSRYVKAHNKYGESGPSGFDAAYTAIETPTGIAFGTVGNQSIELNATGTLSNLAADGSGLYFDETGGSNSGIHEWVKVTTDTATSLTPNTPYTFRVRAQNGDSVETPYSATAQKYTLATQPGALALSGISASSIQANWNAGAPANPGGTVYLVECYEGSGFGGTRKGDSGEITTLSHTFNALDPNKQYSFRVHAKNGEALWTAWTDLGSAYTRPNAPGALSIDTVVMAGARLNLTAPGCRSLSMISIALSGNPAGTKIAIKVQSGGWLRFVGNDVKTDGAAEEWHTAAEWANKRIRGLTPNTSYTFEAKAKNDDTTPLESALVAVGTYLTNKDGDVNRSGSTTILDLTLVRNELIAGTTIGVDNSWAADVNDSRQVDVLDMAAVRSIILAGGN